MAKVTTRVTKRSTIDQFKQAIDTYCEESMTALSKLYDEGKITGGQLSRYSIYDCSYYHWLYGGRSRYSTKKQPCRLYGWAYEETKLFTFRFYLAQFNEWIEISNQFIKAVQDAHAGNPDIEYIANQLPRDLVALLEEERAISGGVAPKDHSMRGLVREVQWFKKKCELEKTTAPTQIARDTASFNHAQCLCWLKNFYKPEVIG